MIKRIELLMSPQEAVRAEARKSMAARALGTNISRINSVLIRRRSIDARQKQVAVRLLADVYIDEQPADEIIFENKFSYEDVSGKPAAIIVGCGPAGMFAALRLIELGIKPVIIERGKDVRNRRRDLAVISRQGIVNPDSNYCFGEGGAGTYSDGKLYTRSKKRGDVQRILEILVAHGAKDEILFDAHPHIGTNKLPKLVAELRESIKQAGGEIHFQTRVTDFVLDGSELKGIRTQNGDVVGGRATILATGHSARDIFHLLYDKKILIEAKPFALGVRVEHQQRLIDAIQYHCQGDRGAYLPAAAYALVHQAKINGKDKGVFSFCMCPGGFIVPAATSPGELVVNGMNPSQRNARYANSGIVVAVDENDYQHLHRFGALAAMQLPAAV